MSLVLHDPTTARLVTRLAAQRGMSHEEAVRSAVQAALYRPRVTDAPDAATWDCDAFFDDAF